MESTRRSTRFLLNGETVDSELWGGTPLLDFLRRDRGLTGTKEGCREGDCGACAVLIGEFLPGEPACPRYRAHPSCLMSLGELEGRQLLTIEGLAAGAEAAGLEGGLTPVMRALLEENGSQCGFCSPGFVVSLSAWLLEGEALDAEGAVRAIEGNLCRCTGYASIRRAAGRILEALPSLPSDPRARLEALVSAGVVPASILGFAEAGPGRGAAAPGGAGPLIGGGSDLYVREPHPDPGLPPFFTRLDPGLGSIGDRGGEIAVGSAVTVRDFFSSALVRSALPGIEEHEAAFASILVRNRATLGGNLANASPVGDLSALLLGLGARLELRPRDQGGPARALELSAFFLSYKKIDLREGELIAAVIVPKLAREERFGFEKLSKRESLDIAAVNTALRLRLAPDGRRILEARLSAGGVAPVPLLLRRSSAYLVGRDLGLETALGAARLAASEVEPISDARGSAGYRREGLARLVLAHFVRFDPTLAGAVAAALADGPAWAAGDAGAAGGEGTAGGAA